MPLHLGLVEDMWERGWSIGWFDVQPDGSSRMDVLLGEPISDKDAITHRQNIAALRGAQRVKVTCCSTSGAYIWETKKHAARAMRLARAELKAIQTGRPFPDWAKQALAEGWKPPRRWRPTK